MMSHASQARGPSPPPTPGEPDASQVSQASQGSQPQLSQGSEVSDQADEGSIFQHMGSETEGAITTTLTPPPSPPRVIASPTRNGQRTSGAHFVRLNLAMY